MWQVPPAKNSFLHKSNSTDAVESIARCDLLVSKPDGVVQLPVWNSSSRPKLLLLTLL